MTKLAGFVLCLIESLASAQDQKPIDERLSALRYPDLAFRTRIQGDVQVTMDAGGPRLLSGNQLLAPGSLENAQVLDVGGGSVEYIFHYELVDAGYKIIQRREPKGNAFGRLILRVLHQPTSRTVSACVETKDNLPPVRADLTKNPVEVWIYGGARCIQGY